jgi:hypothetical protein
MSGTGYPGYPEYLGCMHGIRWEAPCSLCGRGQAFASAVLEAKPLFSDEQVERFLRALEQIAALLEEKAQRTR